MKRAVLLTGHFPGQKRRPSLLWVSDHLQRTGWHVTHAVVGYSWLSRLRADKRLSTLDCPPKPGTERLSASLTCLYGLSPLHPFSTGLRPLDALLRPLHGVFPAYWSPKLAGHLAHAQLVIAESGPPVMLAPIIARHAPRAARIYRINDDIRLLNAPHWLTTLEHQNSLYFTRISTASPYLARRFATHPNVTLDPMGVPQNRLKVSISDPFRARLHSKIAVCAGTTQIDIQAITRIARDRPNWQIHVLGALKAPPPALPNVTWHGEQSFETTLAYIAHADIGLAPYPNRPGIEYQATNSNRILLYRHFGLPILGPDRLCQPSVPSIIGYRQPGAYDRCETLPRRPEQIPDWSALADHLVQNPDTEPPDEVSTVPDTFTWPLV